MKTLGIAIGLVALSATAFAEITLKDIKGHELVCDIVEASPNGYTLVAAGKRLKVTSADLDVDSAKAALDYAKGKGVYRTFPAVDVQVMVGTRRRAQGSFM